MIKIYETNGLPFWTEKDIDIRNYFERMNALEIKNILRNMNSQWNFHRIEGTLLTPSEYINSNYTSEDVFVQTDNTLTLRPETTASSYKYAEYLIERNICKPPMVVWQSGKSFRIEQDQVVKNCRFKEFYQQEFQCLYSVGTKNDYQGNVLLPLKHHFEKLLGKKCRVIDSDRLPSYSDKTVDIEVYNGDKWMEICSISLRKDFTKKVIFGQKEIPLLVLEIAIGLDRLVYNYTV